MKRAWFPRKGGQVGNLLHGLLPEAVLRNHDGQCDRGHDEDQATEADDAPHHDFHPVGGHVGRFFAPRHPERNPADHQQNHPENRRGRPQIAHLQPEERRHRRDRPENHHPRPERPRRRGALHPLPLVARGSLMTRGSLLNRLPLNPRPRRQFVVHDVASVPFLLTYITYVC
jgi:hypothetical protein